MKLKDLNIGDKVWHGGDSSFTRDDIRKITKISFKYDENTGEKYKIIHLDNAKFDSRTGNPLTPPWAYYIQTLD